jgi:hypothetical protein
MLPTFVCLVMKNGITFVMKKGNNYIIKVRHAFFGYYEDVKGYILLEHHSIEIFIRRDANFDKVSRIVSLIQCLCHVRPTSHIWFLCHLSFPIFLLMILL